MSKIHNHIVSKDGLKPDFPQTLVIGIEHNKVPDTEQKIIVMEQAPNKSNLSASHQSSDAPHTMREEDQNFRFSRFEPWHLTQMAQNTKVERQTEENRVYAEKNLQQFNSESQEDEQYFYTPVKPESFNIFDKKSGVVASTKKKPNLINTIAERKLRPKQKGLRKLSGKAFQIVKQLGQATYKTVALRLIKEIQEDQSQPDDDREENNIKRRVYDALNVLIAMQILHKRGRNIVYESDTKLAHQQSMNILYKEERQKFIENQRQKQLTILKKKDELRLLHHKIKIINQIMNKNKVQNPKNENGVIYLPFVCLQVTQPAIKSIEQLNNKQQFKITTKNQYSFFGDIEFLLKHPTYKLD